MGFNRYKSIYNEPDDNNVIVQVPKTVTAETMESAIKVLKADKGSEPYSIEVAELGALVADQTQEVSFTASASPAGAVSAGAVATPSSFSVLPGTLVIFEASVAAGYDFDKWTKNGVDAGTDMKQEIGITEDATVIVAVYVTTP